MLTRTRYSTIQHIILSLERYVTARIPTGSFLEAVLSNDLKEACARADDENRPLLFDIVQYLYNEVPGNCWGSRERVRVWLDAQPESEAGDVN